MNVLTDVLTARRVGPSDEQQAVPYREHRRRRSEKTPKMERSVSRTGAMAMSHASAWTCRSCRAVLGHVRDGVLRPVVPVESVDARGVARVPCPDCGRARIWVPSMTTAIPDRFCGSAARHE
jgi:hypothetical protein